MQFLPGTSSRPGSSEFEAVSLACRLHRSSPISRTYCMWKIGRTHEVRYDRLEEPALLWASVCCIKEIPRYRRKKNAKKEINWEWFVVRFVLAKGFWNCCRQLHVNLVCLPHMSNELIGFRERLVGNLLSKAFLANLLYFLVLEVQKPSPSTVTVQYSKDVLSKRKFLPCGCRRCTKCTRCNVVGCNFACLLPAGRVCAVAVRACPEDTIESWCVHIYVHQQRECTTPSDRYEVVEFRLLLSRTLSQRTAVHDQFGGRSTLLPSPRSALPCGWLRSTLCAESAVNECGRMCTCLAMQ